ncbi:MAG: DUF4190 domain-containing protein [Acidimicrobiales bacterium]
MTTTTCPHGHPCVDSATYCTVCGAVVRPAAPVAAPVPAMTPPTNGLAIASLVLGIVWLGWLGSILALIFGIVARQQIRRRREAGEGLAIAGIVLGSIGVATLIATIVLYAVAAHHAATTY